MTIFRCEHGDSAMWQNLKILLFLFALASCQRPEVAICEEFIKEGLKSPSSYKRIRLNVSENPLNLQKFVEDHPNSSILKKEKAKTGQLNQRFVTIEYDATNGFGVLIRSNQICEFHTLNGELPSREMMKARMKSNSAARDMRELGRQGMLPNQPKIEISGPRYECCEN